MNDPSARKNKLVELVERLLNELEEINVRGGQSFNRILDRLDRFHGGAMKTLEGISKKDAAKFKGKEHAGITRGAPDLTVELRKQSWKEFLENLVEEIENHPEEFWGEENSNLSSVKTPDDFPEKPSAEYEAGNGPTEQQLAALKITDGLLKELSDLQGLSGPEGFRRFQRRAVKRIQAISVRESEDFTRIKVPDVIVRSPNERPGRRLEELKLRWMDFIGNLASEISFHPEEVFEDKSSVSPDIDIPTMQGFHPKVVDAAAHLWRDRHYRQAILDTYIALVDAVKEKSGRRDLDGTPLMQTVFSANSPILKVSDDEDEQKGFMWLFTGAVMGIRNPKAHRLVPQEDPQRAYEWLSFASVLFRALDDCEVVNPGKRS